MKLRILGFLIVIFSTTSSIQGEEEHFPFFGGGQYDYVGRADFDESELHGEHLSYHVGRANLGAVCYYNPNCKEGIALGVSYTNTYLQWKENPYFDQSSFNNVSLNLSGFTHRAEKWNWRANVSANFDVDHFDPDEYLTFDLLLWGRRAYTENLGFNIGFYAITGMKIDRVYPVIGIDWQCWEKLKLNLVFPVDINATWEFNKTWSTGAAIRFFESRQRAGENEPVPRSLFIYRTYGAEYFVNYNMTKFIHLNVHGGYTFSGKLKLANRHYEHSHHYKTKGAPYIGGTLVLAY